MKFLLIAMWMAMALVAVARPTLSDDFDLANVTDAVAWTGNSVEDPTVHTLEKRHTVTCDTGFHTNGFQVYLGIKELRKRRGSPFGGPYACTRVYNKRGTRIYWCNDDSKVRYLPSYNNIADAVQSVFDVCGTPAGFSGECNHPDKWRAFLQHGWNMDER